MAETYRVNELFHSLQGEGFYTGTSAVFVRFSGCNLRCPFCDTDHEKWTGMSADEIVSAVSAYPAVHVVLTGGEPTLSVDEALTDALHKTGKFIALETNGTGALPRGIDWVTCSPKPDLAPVVLKRCDELKVVYLGQDMSVYDGIEAAHHFLQPCDTGNPRENARLLSEAIEYCKAHPLWRLSLQTHKLLNIR